MQEKREKRENAYLIFGAVKIDPIATKTTSRNA